MATRQLSTKRIVNLTSDPVSGTTGELYYNTAIGEYRFYNGVTWTSLVDAITGATTEQILSDTPPLSPNAGDIWFDTTTGKTYFYYGTIWVEVGTSEGGRPLVLSGDVTGTGTDNIATTLGPSGVAAGTYGSTTSIPVVTVDVKGRVTNISVSEISAGTSLNVAGETVKRDAEQSFDITAIDFDTVDTISSAIGRLNWDSGEGTLSLGLAGGNVNLQLGQENVVRCYNGTGTTITDGTVVYINGAQGQRPSLARAQANSEAASSKTLGLATEDITNGAEGFVTTFGLINGLDTSAFTAGQALWLSPTVAGGLTATKPVAPNHAVFVGYVISISPTAGRIFVNPQNGYELNEIHDVLITSATDRDALIYDSATGLWKNEQINLGTDTVGNYVASISGTANEIEVSGTGEGAAVTIGLPNDVTIGNNLIVTGTLTVNGTTTTVNSTTLTIDDPILTLGGDTAPIADDNKDRGVEFRYYDTQARLGFMGYDDSTGYFTFLTAATNTSEVFSGTKGTIDVNGITQAADNNTTALATTAFVVGQASSSNPVMDGTVAIGTSLRYARADHVHPTDTSRAPDAGTVTTRSTAISTNSSDFNTFTSAGTYQVSGNATWTGSTNGPTSAYGYGQLVVSVNGNIVNQMYYAHSLSGHWVRTKFNAADWTAWQRVWTDQNDGSSSGLDADLLDGQHGSYYATDTAVVHIAGSETITGAKTFSAQLISTRANDTATNGGQIFLNGATGNRIDFNSNGVSAPTFTTRSAGTKIVLFPALSGSAVDYAVGIDAGILWNSVPVAANGFAWYAGTTQIASITGAGAFSAVTKSFDIQHPTKENMRLRYGSLEGPENGVYVRGKTKSSIITLPDYWTGLVDEDSITVQLTPYGKIQRLYVKNVSDNTVEIGGVNGEFYYFIQAERNDVDRLIVEYPEGEK